MVVTTSVINGLAQGISATLVLTLTKVGISAGGSGSRPQVHMSTFVLIGAPLVTTIGLVMNAYFHQLYAALGIYLPMVAVSCTLIGCHDQRACNNAGFTALLHGLRAGAELTIMLMSLGSVRELLGHGTLLAQGDLLFGAHAPTLTLFSGDLGFALAVLPSGAFISLGLLIALKNSIAGDKGTKSRSKDLPSLLDRSHLRR